MEHGFKIRDKLLQLFLQKPDLEHIAYMCQYRKPVKRLGNKTFCARLQRPLLMLQLGSYHKNGKPLAMRRGQAPNSASTSRSPSITWNPSMTGIIKSSRMRSYRFARCRSQTTTRIHGGFNCSVARSRQHAMDHRDVIFPVVDDQDFGIKNIGRGHWILFISYPNGWSAYWSIGNGYFYLLDSS